MVLSPTSAITLEPNVLPMVQLFESGWMTLGFKVAKDPALNSSPQYVFRLLHTMFVTDDAFQTVPTTASQLCRQVTVCGRLSAPREIERKRRVLRGGPPKEEWETVLQSYASFAKHIVVCTFSEFTPAFPQDTGRYLTPDASDTLCPQC